MLRDGKVVICPNCPRKTLVESVKSKSWCLQETQDNVAKICAKIRSYDCTLPRCPKYPEAEILDPWLIFNWGENKRTK